MNEIKIEHWGRQAVADRQKLTFYLARITLQFFVLFDAPDFSESNAPGFIQNGAVFEGDTRQSLEAALAP